MLGFYLFVAFASVGEGVIIQLVLFLLLGIQLLIINRVLHNQMKAIFGKKMVDEKFKHEKRYLFITLVSFSISYLIDVLRNMVIFFMLEIQREI